jgi:putative DNA primase/helicase
MAKKQDQHPAQLARLFGKRLVVCVETHEGARLDEALVKELTGGDPITARGMREDPWQFYPTHKPILITNHRPEIRGTDEGIWRRPRLIPFTVHFWNPDDPENRDRQLPPRLMQDKRLAEKLRAEHPGILAWCVQGCVDWQRYGLQTPDAVKVATKNYRSDQDVLGAFVQECCVTGADYQCKASELYLRYQRWCETNGEKNPVSQRKFGEALTERGFERFTNNGTRYRKIAVRPCEGDETTS